MRRWLIRAVGSAIILAVLFVVLPVGQIIDGVARVPLTLFLSVWLFFFVGHVFAAGKWWALLGWRLGYVDALKAHVAGLAANLCLPGAAGGDVVRAAAAQMTIRDGGKVISGALADRLIDMLALAVLAISGAYWLASGGAWTGPAAQVFVLVMLLVAGSLWLAPVLLPWLWRRIPALPARDLVERTSAELAELSKKPVLLFAALALSTAIQALFVVLAMRLGLAIGIELSPAAWLFAWPLAKLLAILPISLNGLGVREATLAGLMVPLGAAGADVVAAGLAWQAVLFATGGLGALVLIASGFKLRPDAAVAQSGHSEQGS